LAWLGSWNRQIYWSGVVDQLGFGLLGFVLLRFQQRVRLIGRGVYDLAQLFAQALAFSGIRVVALPNLRFVREDNFVI
jgi:phosphatidylserine/phosphatidylglycerophosphate/cardiolipin synthase-like enzyme